VAWQCRRLDIKEIAPQALAWVLKKDRRTYLLFKKVIEILRWNCEKRIETKDAKLYDYTAQPSTWPP
jgi:hypothetical protein